MLIGDAQREVRTVYVGGFFGQLVSAAIWFASAALGTWSTPRAAIIALVFGGVLIFPLTKLLLQATPRRGSMSPENSLNHLAMQIAFGLPLTMLLLVPATNFRLTLFYPATMILLGAHYLPFAFLYGMRMFLPLGAILISAGVFVGLYLRDSFAIGGWITAAVLLVFAFIGRFTVFAEARAAA